MPNNKFPLSKTEYGIYFDCISNPESTAYNLPFSIEMNCVDIDKLSDAIKRVIIAHPYLNTKFAQNEIGDVYKYQSNAEPHIYNKKVDDDFNVESLISPFDLNCDTLYRIYILEKTGGCILFCDFHHTIFDGTSIILFINEVNRVYSGSCAEAERFTANDIAQEEIQRISSADFINAKKYYNDVFGVLDCDSTPIRDKNEDIKNTKKIIRVLDSIEENEVRCFAKKNGIKTSTIFNAVFGFLLAKQTGAKECLYSTIFNGRDERIANSYGMFVKTLPVYCNISETDDIAEYLKNVDNEIAKSRENSIYSYADVCSDLNIKSNVLFAYQGDYIKEYTFCGNQTEVQYIDSPDSKELWTISVYRNKGKFEFHFEYRADLYEDDIMFCLIDEFDKALCEFMTKSKLSQVSLLSEKSKKMLDSFNENECEYDSSVSIVDLFNNQVKLTPDNTAVVYLDKKYTYKQVDEISNNIAGYLSGLGIGREDVVSVLIPRCEYMVLASLGVLKSGAGYQPLDPSYPVDRLEFMMKDASAKLLIADRSLMDKVPNYNGRVLYIEDIPSLPNCGEPKKSPLPEDLFIMLYTSGSTGVPKGVMLEHRNLVAFCNCYKNNYNLDSSSRVAAYASYGFDANMMDTYPALISGACVHIIDESIRLDLLEIEKYFNDNQITHSFMTTQVGRQFAIDSNCRFLKYLLVGGEKLVPVLPSDNFAFYNVYGPTECTVFVTSYNVDKMYDRIPIGRALHNLKLYVVDENGNRLPAGIPGELCISGHQVGRGYLNRPDQNKKAFTANPFCNKKGYERMYHTGDIVRLLPNGCVDFVGRNDGQVKIRGFRIELTEVEAVIRNFDGIKDATVVAFDETGGGKYIAAYIVSDAEININDLNEYIASVKPSYMVPAVTMQIDKIPLNQNQKVNKKELPVPVKKAEEMVPVQNGTQQKIFDCIADVIGHSNFGITTDIFYAGLTSIGSIKLNVMLSKAFDVVIKISDLKDNNTVKKLEGFICNSTKASEYDILEDYPISQTQNGIFVECVANPGTTIYNIPYCIKISKKIDIERLKNAVEQAINAHAYIKAQLIMNKNGEIRALRKDDLHPNVDVVTTGSLPNDSELVVPYNLLNSPLYRIVIYITDEDNYLLIDFHHIISDGTSLGIFLNDINKAYGGEKLQSETYTGYEFALDEEKLRETDVYIRAKEYWNSVFAGCESEYLLPKDSKTGVPGRGAFERKSSISADKIKKYCEENSITLNAFFNAVFGFVLAKFNYKEDSVYTTIYNGRSDSRLESTAAMLVKTFPVYCNADGEIGVHDFIKSIGEQIVNSMSNDIYSFAEISKEFGIKADIMFVYQGDSFEFDNVGGEKAEPVLIEINMPKAPISIDIFMKNSEFVFVCEYRNDLYNEETIVNITECFDAAADSFMESNVLKEVSLLNDRAWEKIQKFNATDVEIERTTCNKLFERQVELHPDKTAVIANKESLTYGELNAAANCIANSLIETGVKSDDMISVMMPRTVYAYAAREGILKSGGAYVPLDPKYPDDRISYILSDSKSEIIVTTQQFAQERNDLFKNANVKVLIIEELLKNKNTSNPDPDITPENLCYCIYTSGSTGKPKGVMIEHHSLVNFVHYNKYNQQAQEYCENMTVSLALAALTFDVSVLEEAMPLYHGATVAMANEDEINNPMLLAKMLEKNKVDVMKCTPSYMNNMLDIPDIQKVLANMKAIDIGAEAFPAPLYDKMRKAGITAKIYNGYGPTEATITTSIDYLESNHITIGRPLCNTKVLMLDKYRNILPAGVPGELTILGECVGRGYAGNEAMTKDRFISFAGMPAYRSGDLASWSFDGKINFFGRMDNQVKLRGLRVELDEIENVMNEYSTVLRSVVLVKENEKAGQFLCGYFTGSEAVNKDKLTEHMKKSLTHYMIPSVLIQLDSLPLNNNGKVDKKALPEPEFEMPKRAFTPPQTELQKHLCEMFESALNLSPIGIDDDFFEIGGTSLSASKIAMRAMMEKLPIAFADIFENPTVEKLERFIINKNKKSSIKDDSDKQDEVVLDGAEKALMYNTADNADQVVYTDIGNVLLTGATGFLGIHILKEIIDHTNSKVYCLIRKGKAQDVETRMKSMLVYYFEDAMDDLFDSRIFVIDGDITDKETVMALKKYDFDTLINCAACVKHFANDDILDRINVQGVKNLIELCKSAKRRLVQISTVSVAGENINNQLPVEKVIFENELYFGQDLSNKYVNTKFRAEEAILKAIADEGLDGKIIRVGNLMSRQSDGEFQINSITNGFMRNLRAYAAIGKFPVSQMDNAAEFSPIDCTARSIMCLSGTNKQFTVYHSCNGHKVEMGDVIACLNNYGIKVDVVSDSEFSSAMMSAMKDESKNMLISGLISYLDSDSEKTRSYVGYNNTFTTKALYMLNFKWPITDEKYLTKAIKSLDTLGYFDGRFE